jgi:hypothetical protein
MDYFLPKSGGLIVVIQKVFCVHYYSFSTEKTTNIED